MDTTNAQLSAPEMLELYGISTEDINQLRILSDVVDAQIDGIVENFYVWLSKLPDFDHFFTDEHIVERVKELQKAYWSDFFRNERDEQYIAKRRLVGETHARIGLSLGSYCAAMNQMHSLIVSRLSAEKSASADLDIVAKFMNMDMAIVIETYSKVINESIAAQSQAMMEMSTPVTQIWEGILMLPVVGIIDSKRAQEIMATTLSKISETQAQVFIMDISGVAVIDTQVANHMIQVTKATRLMGCESTISGLSPSIAETIVQLGIDVGKVRTTATLKDALSSAFRRIGMAIKEASDET